MNPLDIVVVVVIVFCLIRGIFRGLIKEVSSIVGVFGGFYASYTFYGAAADLLSGLIDDEAIRNIVGFLITFGVVFAVISLLGVLIKYVLRAAALGKIDRICGAGFGITKGILIVSVLLFAFTTFLPKNASIVKDSWLSPHVTVVSTKLAKIVPKDMRNEFNDKVAGLKEFWEELSYRYSPFIEASVEAATGLRRKGRAEESWI